jgi:hypothetical protein
MIRYNLGLFSNGGNIEAKKTAVAGRAFEATTDKC